MQRRVGDRAGIRSSLEEAGALEYTGFVRARVPVQHRLEAAAALLDDLERH